MSQIAAPPGGGPRPSVAGRVETRLGSGGAQLQTRGRTPVSLFFQTLVNGLLVGGLYVTLPIGFSLAFGVLDVVDFAVGEWVMLGAFAGIGAKSWFAIDPFIALPVVFVVFAAGGALIAPLIYRQKK